MRTLNCILEAFERPSGRWIFVCDLCTMEYIGYASIGPLSSIERNKAIDARTGYFLATTTH